VEPDRDQKVLSMFKSLIGLAAASVVLISLAGCSTANGTTPNTGASTKPSSAAQAADRTYTAADLTTILTSAKKTLGSDGTIVTDAQLKKLTASSGGISSLLTKKGLTFAPAACGKLITSKLPSATNGYGLGSSAIGAALTSGTSSLAVSSVAGKALPASITSDMTTSLDSLLSTCGSMTMTLTLSGQSFAIHLTIKRVDVTTKATQTIGLRETLELPAIAGKKSAPVTITIVQAREGNLLVASTDPTGTTSSAADLTKGINAVLDAAAAEK
jgi:hypothetical protein